MVSNFRTKFFCAETKVPPTELGRTKHYPGKDLDLYVRRFQEEVLGCCDPVDQEVLEFLSPRHGR